VIDLSNRPAHGGNLTWAAELAHCSIDALFDFSASINPLGPPATAIAALQSLLQPTQPTALTAYPDPTYRRLRGAIAQHHGVLPDWVLPGNGAAELLTWACRDLAAESATALLVPSFGDYRRALAAFAATVQPVPLEAVATLPDLGTPTRGTPTRGTPTRRTRTRRTRTMGLLLNNPHNPSGQLFPRAVLAACLERFALVVVDEAFMDFLPGEPESVVSWVSEYPNLVVVRSLTKFYSLPGLRLGYAIAHPDRLRRWQQWRDPWSVNTLAAAVGETVLQDRAFQQQTWDWLATCKPMLQRGIHDIPGLTTTDSAANFLLVHSDRPVPPLQLALLRHHKILIRDCLSFPELGDRYFRIAIRTAAENERLLAALETCLANRDEVRSATF
jgi:L-threonine-O-3-phosphate decarboxylase